jgi:hypothetical protein
MILSLLWLCFFLNTKAQSAKNYMHYIDTVNSIVKPDAALGEVLVLKYKPGVGFGDVRPKPYHISFNFNSSDIKEFFGLCMEELERVNMLDSLLIDTVSIACPGYKTRLYLPKKLPFSLQSAILKAMAKQVTAVNEIVFTSQRSPHEVLIGGGNLSNYIEGDNYLRSFSKIRAIAKAKSQEELLQLFKDLDDKKPMY